MHAKHGWIPPLLSESEAQIQSWVSTAALSVGLGSFSRFSDAANLAWPIKFSLSHHCFWAKKNMTRCTSWLGQMCRLPASIYFIRNLWMCLISLQDFECAKDTWNHFREAFPVTFRVDIIQGHPFWNFTRLQHFVSYPSVEKTPQRGIIYNSVSPILSLFF